ncbi:MAG: mannose-1-phosphate guanylyltransferase/mannose-6-phosphate isomerase [Acidimicrobiales bacterium]|nr:mannose-1-phosphate guanylyltransferase/mannose-6-phosphate isomerase [Hyphomonadaceae bacterium]RZV37239.1 MAG: mannose-1-phosphate guanylyltransferase/mannose-6-phosphate isomerase [Acidimicrobiales bacterium]
MTKIYPVIMCGGAGTRLWPLSRKSKAKQYHNLVGDLTMLQETILRMQGVDGVNVADPSFVCAEQDGEIVKEQSAAIGADVLRVILEPMGRNTAPLAAIVSQLFDEIDPEGLILLLPADHHIANKDGFWSCVAKGAESAKSGKLVTLGIQPQGPETGYGYIKSGKMLASDVYEVEKFVEKPNLETAKSYLASGDYYWNAGIFLFSPQTMIASFAQHAEDIQNTCQTTLTASTQNGPFLHLDGNNFSQVPSDSIDYAIMERADNVAIVAPVDIGWSDIGSWSELANLVQSLDAENRNQDNIIALDCKDSYLRTDGPLIAGIGLEDLIVVVENNTVLIMPKDKAQDVKKVVAGLKDKGRDDLC